MYVRNPMNMRQIGKVSLSPSVVDGLVIWIKNPIPMMGRLDELEKYPYYFQFTLTSLRRRNRFFFPGHKTCSNHNVRMMIEKIKNHIIHSVEVWY